MGHNINSETEVISTKKTIIMKTTMKVFFSIVFILTVPLIIKTSCQKDSSIEHIERPAPYILKLLDSIPCDSPYYVRITFEDSEIYYAASDSNISLFPESTTGYGNTIGKGYSFREQSSSHWAEIMFYKNKSVSDFSFQPASYRFGNPWYSISGANIHYFYPTGTESSYYMYLGTNVTDGYFWITWLDEDRICGQFKAKLIECCGGTESYWVEGDFSIPRVKFD